MGETLLTSTEAATELGVNQSRVRQMLRSGELTGEKHGRDWLVHRKAIEAAKAKRAKAAQAGGRGRPPRTSDK